MSTTTSHLTEYTVRLATPADTPALERLAALEQAAPLRGVVLVAEHEGAAVAAVSVGDARALADPFLPTAQAVALLRLRAHQLVPAEAGRQFRAPRLRRPAALARTA